MQDKAIGIQDLQRKALELLQQGDQLEHGVIYEFLKYAHENHEHLAPEAAAVVDRLVEALKPEIERVVEELPDTIETRQLKREYARVMWNWNAAALIGGLEAPPSPKHPIIAASRSLFERHLQHYLDLLLDVTQHTHQGPAAFVRMIIFALCADELLVSYHSAVRGYAGQALSHVRTVFEALALVELFTQFPDLAEAWVEADEKTAQREFKPSKVRKKLGREARDLIYSFLSEHGTHVTWRAIRNRTAVKADLSDKGNREMMLWVGGTPIVHTLVISVFSVLQALVLATFKLVIAFGKYMHLEDAKGILVRMSQEFSQFVLDHLVAWMKEEGIPTDDIEEFIRTEIPRRLRELENFQP